MVDVDLVRYQLAHAEMRAEVELGWQRAQLFIALNPIVLVLAVDAEPLLAKLSIVTAAVVSMAGVLVLDASHERYRATRAVLLELALELHAEADWKTTGGMREFGGRPRGEGPRITTIVQMLLWAYVVLDILATGCVH